MAPQTVVGRQGRATDGSVVVLAVVEGHEDQR
jgi:hypothetical protein